MIPYTLKFNYIGEWARQQGLFKLRVTGVAYGFRGLKRYVTIINVYSAIFMIARQ